MAAYLRRPATHAARLERWLGAETLALFKHATQGRDLEPIPVANCPGVFSYDGDFYGGISGGGFASLSDLISEMTTGGKGQLLNFSKTGITAIVGVAADLWRDAGIPGASPAAAGFAAGESPDNTSAYGLGQTNATGGDTLHFINGWVMPTVGANLVLLYDRFYQGNHTMTVDPQSVTGVPGRYQSTDAKGCFIGQFVTTILPAATPTYTVTYMDQDGNTAENAAAQTIVSGAIVGRFPYALTVGGGWRIPLNAGDTGVRKITNLDLSAAMASGACDVFLGKPIAWLPAPIANIPYVVDGVNSFLSLTRVYDGACLALMEVAKGAVTATTYTGSIMLASG